MTYFPVVSDCSSTRLSRDPSNIVTKQEKLYKQNCRSLKASNSIAVCDKFKDNSSRSNLEKVVSYVLSAAHERALCKLKFCSLINESFAIIKA